MPREGEGPGRGAPGDREGGPVWGPSQGLLWLALHSFFFEKVHVPEKSAVLGHFFEARKVAEHVRAGIPCGTAAEFREMEP